MKRPTPIGRKVEEQLWLLRDPSPGDIGVKLQQVEALIRQGMPQTDAIRHISVTEQTYCRGEKSTAEWAQNNSSN